ncbi:MAG: amidohydrolase family protein, partial [Deltaproteobacteria bacterium]|nr:amidohydrolase family protein [Deltaproteobacteria bacterium]
MKMLIRGGRVIDPSRGLDKILDIFVKGGKIKDIAANIAMTDPSCTVIDATGKIVAPGLLDIHVHLREPGHEYKETILSGCEAAVAGGFTSIASMANTNPANDNHSVTEFIIRKAEAAGIANVFPVAALSIGLEGKLMTEFADLKEAGAAALSDDGKPVKSASFMRKALEYAASLDLPVISHCEDTTLSAGGQINEGIVSTALGLQGIPSAAEEIMVARDIALAEYCRAPVHIAHVSAA